MFLIQINSPNISDFLVILAVLWFSQTLYPCQSLGYLYFSKLRPYGCLYARAVK